MRRPSSVLLGVFLLVASACGSDTPSHYQLLDGEIPFVAEIRPGGCRLGYGSQVALVDPADGIVLRIQDVPFAGFLRQTDENFAALHFTGNQASGIVAFDQTLDVTYQSEFPGKLRAHLPEGAVPIPEDRLLLRGQKSNKQTSLVLIEASSGEAIWEAVTPSLSTSPVLAGATLIAATFEDDVLGLDVETGEELWRTPVRSSLRGIATERDSIAYLPGAGRVALIDETGEVVGEWQVVGETSSVQLVNSSVALVGTYVNGRFKLVAFEASSGRQLWSVLMSDERLFRTNQQLAVFVSLEHDLRAVDLATGRRAWLVSEAEVERTTGLGVEGTYAYVAIRRGDNDNQVSWHLAAINSASEGVVSWEVDLPGNVRMEPTVMGPTVLVGGYPAKWDSSDIVADDQGWLHAYDRHTGELLWETSLRDSPTQLAQGPDGYVVLTADPTVFCD